jgi:hypothetical protein
MQMHMQTIDTVTGRPQHGGSDAVETLSEEELETELTIAVLEPGFRERRYEQLWRELLSRRRGYGKHPTPMPAE